MKKLTLQDIADKAGVSKSTASYALNNAYKKGVNITEETRLRIKKIADKAGYVIDDMARAISTGKIKVLGFAYGQETAGENFIPILTSLMDAAAEHDFFVKTLCLRAGGAREFAAVCLRQRLSAAVFYVAEEKTLKDVVAKLGRTGIIPAVIGNSVTPDNCIHVRCDDAAGCGMMVKKLHELGHRKIAFMSASFEYPASVIRRDAYLEAMKDLSLKVPKGYFFGSKEPGELRKWLLGLLKSPGTRPDAVFCSGDNVATLAISTIHEFGLKVPAGVSVAGFGDLPCGRFFAPRISTVDECHRKCAGRIVEKIMAELSGRDHGAFYETVTPSLIIKDSTSAKKN